ncbi:MAG: Cof-type HAD-IIB family hydrolase [Actinomycetota bacterium]|nr:Cof-type HAD-IIB family hydrolase [Actinomycetota bacterium]
MSVEHDGKTNGLPFDLCAFDLDGTILRRDLVITERTMDAVSRLRARGARLVVATGRQYEGAREHARRLGFRGSEPVICYGGAMIRSIDGETLLHRTIDRDLGVEVLEWAQERGLHVRIFLDGHIVSSPRTTALLENLKHPEVMEVSVVDSPADWLREATENPTKIVFVDYPDRIGGWLEDAREAFSGRLFVTRSLPHYVEVGGLEGTKSQALGYLCEKWGIESRRTLAFGDADNDIDMLRFAGHGVVIGGLTEAVREAADTIAPPVDEDGVAHYVEELLGKS